MQTRRRLVPHLAWAYQSRLFVLGGKQIHTSGVAHEADGLQPLPFHESPQHLPPSATSDSSTRWQAIRQAKPFSAFLTDNYGRQHDYLRISITERCNLRCLYCMPEEGVQLSPQAHLLTTPEIVYLSSLFVSQGVTKIRLTGGEPTVRPDILPLMRQIGALRDRGLKELALTTNGISLHRKLDDMVEAGLTGINISLDTLDPFQFQIMTRRKGFDAVMKSIEKALSLKSAGVPLKLKINCVVMRGINDREIIPFVELGAEKDVEVRFIEYMPFDGNKWNKNKMLSYQEMLDLIREKYPGIQQIRGHQNDTSKTWKVPGFVGRVGFITSMTHNFCGTCNRLRITGDGNLKVCLFGNSEVSLRDMIRKGNEDMPMNEAAFESIRQTERDRREGLTVGPRTSPWAEREAELLDTIGMAVKRKKERHAGIGELENMKNRPMILIGEAKSVQGSTTHPSTRPNTRNSTKARPPWLSIPVQILAGALSSQKRLMSTTLERPMLCTERHVRSIQNMGLSTPVNADSGSSGDHHTTVRRLNLNPTRILSFPKASKDPQMLGPSISEASPLRIDALSLLNSPTDQITDPSDGRMQTHNRRGEEDGSDAWWTIGSEDGADDDAKVALDKSRPDTSNSEPGDGKSKALASKMTHISEDGDFVMVDVSSKGTTTRIAVAGGLLHFSSKEAYQRAISIGTAKGDVMSIAQIAGIQAAKRTGETIPLCHNIPLSSVKVRLEPARHTLSGTQGTIRITAVVRTVANTGVEMEALSAVSGAALTAFDMCKAMDKGMAIGHIKVLYKAGGVSGLFIARHSRPFLRGLISTGLLPKAELENITSALPASRS